MFMVLLGVLRYNKRVVKDETARVLAYPTPPLTIAKGEFRMAASDYTPEVIERFWSQVDRRSDDECWEWRGKLTRGGRGYGYLHFAGVRHIASRLAYELENGVIPKGLHVLHKCDNPPCCNPKHLFVGTQADNVRDMVEKKRNGVVCGEDNGQHKLTAEQVLDIRRGLLDGVPGRQLARAYGVSPRTIRFIKRNETWKDV